MVIIIMFGEENDWYNICFNLWKNSSFLYCTMLFILYYYIICDSVTFKDKDELTQEIVQWRSFPK